MSQPVWITPAGSLGNIPENLFYEVLLTVVADSPVFFKLIAGTLPPGIQVSESGSISGVPLSQVDVAGVPLDVNRDVTSKFTIRAYTKTISGAVDRIRDRTFTLTVINTNAPVFGSPSDLGFFYDGDRMDLQIVIDNVGPNTNPVVSLIGGQLPGGVSVSESGLISGYIKPAINVNQPPGYDLTPEDVYPYDFLIGATNANYQFTLQVTDGITTDIKTFYFFVYNRSSLNASTTQITADNTQVTADETEQRRPFIVNSSPQNLGTVRSDNYFAHQFIANDYDTPDLKYAISVNQGSGLPPLQNSRVDTGTTDCGLDPNSGWYYGYIPDQGITAVTYSFNIVTYQADFVGLPVTCTATAFDTNYITCTSTETLSVNQPLVFTGTAFGGITASATQVYYVLQVISDTEFTVTKNLGTTAEVELTTATGTMSANLIVASDPYPFLLTISGAENAEVIWHTPSDLGTIDNGSTSMLVIEASNVGGRALKYQLKPGAGSSEIPYPYVPGVYNLLPQGLKLLDTGEISGRVTFNTFALDLGTTTFDVTEFAQRSLTFKETTFDSTFTFTVNAYAEDTTQMLYKVSGVDVINGGSGYVSTPTITFNTPTGAGGVAAEGSAVLDGSTIQLVSVNFDKGGAGYTGPAVITVTPDLGANLQPVMQSTGFKAVVSADKTFTVKVKRVYNKPYQNLLIEAMPPANDRVMLNDLLTDTNIFVNDYIYRPDDPYFGLSKSVVYQHAFGLAPDILETYVDSLYENHYWKNLVLGEINTAQAIDPITGEVVYEVVYSQIVDDLVNAAGFSVSKIVNLPYTIIDPADHSSQIAQVYPNSLINMRDQVIDVVGQISTKLPLWMTSKQTDGRVLGFTPAWVICYTKPGKSQQIAYYIATKFSGSLNTVDFKVDRYVLDHTLSRNWDTVTQNWTPKPGLTTFDRFGSAGLPFIGIVDIATQLAYTDVNNRTLAYINDKGGLDGFIVDVNNNTVIFIKQEYYADYDSIDDAWQDYLYPFDSGTVNGGAGSFDHNEFDEATTIPGGYSLTCTSTSSVTNEIQISTTAALSINTPLWFTDTTFGNIVAIGGNGLPQIYYVTQVVDSTHFTVTDQSVSAGNFAIGTTYTILSVGNTDFTAIGAASNTPGVSFTATGIGSTAVGGTPGTAGKVLTLTTASGNMTANFGNTRMAVFKMTLDPVTTLVTLTPVILTAETQYVQINRGRRFAGVQLYYPTGPEPGYTRVAWQPLPAGSASETTFDDASMAFEAPVDMYDPTDRDDKYLVFPKANILV